MSINLILAVCLFLGTPFSIRAQSDIYTPSELVGGLSPSPISKDIDLNERVKQIEGNLPKMQDYMDEVHEKYPPNSQSTYPSHSQMSEEQIRPDLKTDDDETYKEAWAERNKRISSEVEGKAKLLPSSFQREDWMDRYAKGVIGLDPTKTESENRKRYEDIGYSYSTTISDSVIYIGSGILIAIIIGLIIYFSSKKSFETIK